MKKVKITVLKTTLDRELAAEYGVEGLSACPMMREGQVFYADYAKPEGMCDEAWKAVYQYAFALAHGAGEGLFYYGDWIRKPASPSAAATTAAAGHLQAGGHRGGLANRTMSRSAEPPRAARADTEQKKQAPGRGREPVFSELLAETMRIFDHF